MEFNGTSCLNLRPKEDVNILTDHGKQCIERPPAITNEFVQLQLAIL